MNDASILMEKSDFFPKGNRYFQEMFVGFDGCNTISGVNKGNFTYDF
jgi:hypothetical protein